MKDFLEKLDLQVFLDKNMQADRLLLIHELVEDALDDEHVVLVTEATDDQLELSREFAAEVELSWPHLDQIVDANPQTPPLRQILLLEDRFSILSREYGDFLDEG